MSNRLNSRVPVVILPDVMLGVFVGSPEIDVTEPVWVRDLTNMNTYPDLLVQDLLVTTINDTPIEIKDAFEVGEKQWRRFISDGVGVSLPAETQLTIIIFGDGNVDEDEELEDADDSDWPDDIDDDIEPLEE